MKTLCFAVALTAAVSAMARQTISDGGEHALATDTTEVTFAGEGGTLTVPDSFTGELTLKTAPDFDCTLAYVSFAKGCEPASVTLEGNVTFLTNVTTTDPITIPAGRTLRLEIPGDMSRDMTGKMVPKLALADKTSTLELALPDYKGVPYAYLTNLSGTLVVDQDLTESAVFGTYTEGQELNVVLKAGHTYELKGSIGFADYTEYDGSLYQRATLTVESGATLTVSQLYLNGETAVSGAVHADTLDGTGSVTLGSDVRVGDKSGFTGSITWEAVMLEGGEMKLTENAGRISGTGTLIVPAGITVEDLRDFTGTVKLDGGTIRMVNGDSTVTLEGTGKVEEVACATGTVTTITVAEGASITFPKGLAAGTAEAGTLGALNLTVIGAITVPEEQTLNMTPDERRTLTVAGNPDLTGTASEGHGQLNGPGTYVTVSGTERQGGVEIRGLCHIVSGAKVDTVTGSGRVHIAEGLTVGEVYDFTGTLEGKGTLGALTGMMGEVRLGSWLNGGDPLALAAQTALGYRGMLGFVRDSEDTATEPLAIDFSRFTTLETLPGILLVDDHQHLTMRLDQYADARIRWGAPLTHTTLTLIESGAYGGEVSLPVWPKDVTMTFKSYGAEDALVDKAHTIVRNENGSTLDLTWEDPVLTGKGAWVDVEFNGDSRNTGWYSLGDNNGALGGLPTDEGGLNYGAIITNENCFTEARHPRLENGAIKLNYRPYIGETALAYPETWSVAVRMTAPQTEKKCILALGNNFAETSASDKTYALVFATGAVTEDYTEIVLWKFDGKYDGANNKENLPAEAIRDLFRVRVAEAQSAAHVFSVVCDGTRLTLYMDGAWLKDYTLPEGTTLAGGLQVGQQLGGGHITAAALERAGNVTADDGGTVDYIRFYKGALSDNAMQELADRMPYVRDNLRYVRYVPLSTTPDLEGITKPNYAADETWIQEGAWIEETFDGNQWNVVRLVDQPAEGAGVVLMKANGTNDIMINVERQVEETAEDGTVTNEGRYFYSPNRNYATLEIIPANAGNGTSPRLLRLLPLGAQGNDNEHWESTVLGSAWYTETAEQTGANRTGFRYGRLRFTGGILDPINSADSELYVTAAMHPGAGAAYIDAGAVYFSRYESIRLRAAENGTQTNNFQMVAGLSLTRGLNAESASWRLTGPIDIQGTKDSDPVTGNTAAIEDQASQDVWVPAFDVNSQWKFFDDTRTLENNANGIASGLYARVIKTAARLFLDFTATNGQTNHVESQDFADQAWYLNGYEGDADSNSEIREATADEYKGALAFQIRLDGNRELTFSDLPTSQVQTFRVEESATAAQAETPATLTLTGTPLPIHGQVIASARLDISNDGDAQALDLKPDGDPTPAPIYRGNSDRGALIVGRGYSHPDDTFTCALTFDWDVGAISTVPRVEVHAGLGADFSVPQDFRTHGITLAAQKGALLHFTSTGNLLGTDIELDEGAFFGFHATAATDADDVDEGVVLSGALKVMGPHATLEGTGAPEGGRLPHFFAAKGFVATNPGATLALHAPEGTEWHSHTAAFSGENFGLRKVGHGTVTLYDILAPTVTGKVIVEAGRLNVTGQRDTAVGKYGLEVHHDGTLGDSGRMTGSGDGSDRPVARIAAGQTLSGGGTVDGWLRMEPGSTLLREDAKPFTVTKGVLTEGDVTVSLPKTYTEDTPFLVEGRESRAVRRTLVCTDGTDRLLDTIAWIAGGSTTYAARLTGVPAPSDPDTAEGNTWPADVAAGIIGAYREADAAYLTATSGDGAGGTAAYNAIQLAEALKCFTGIAALTTGDVPEDDRTYIDAGTLTVNYDFGISRMTLIERDDGQFLVAELTVQSALGEADYRDGTTVTLCDGEGKVLENVREVVDLAASAVDRSTTPGKRYVEIPYDGTADLRLRPKVEPPAAP